LDSVVAIAPSSGKETDDALSESGYALRIYSYQSIISGPHMSSFRQFLSISLVLAVVSVSAVVAAQGYGIRGGIQQTNLVEDAASNTLGTETGLTLGGFFNIRLPANLGVSVEGMYTQKILTQQNANVLAGGEFDPDVTLELGTIEIPITVFWQAPLKGPLYPRLYGGPLIGVIVNEKVDLADQSIGEALDEAFVLTKDAFAEREIGWIAGAGLTLSLADLGMGSTHLLADLRYQSGITTVSEEFAGNPLSQELRIGAFTALLGIAF
jgi:hypothetical protein